jgi:2-haloacid dehalogenase
VLAIFDAMGTLFDLSGLDERFEAIGASPCVRRAWFARLLESAHALTMIGEYEPFAELARSTLRTTLAQEGFDSGHATSIAAGLSEVAPYPDAHAALARLREAGVEAVVLTNSGREQTEELLERNGLGDAFRRVFSTEEVRAYKPDPRPYRLVQEELGAAAGEPTFVAAHGWDVLGAGAAGLRAIWIDRLEQEWPFPSAEPERRVPDLVAAAESVASLRLAER